MSYKVTEEQIHETQQVPFTNHNHTKSIYFRTCFIYNETAFVIFHLRGIFGKKRESGDNFPSFQRYQKFMLFQINPITKKYMFYSICKIYTQYT